MQACSLLLGRPWQYDNSAIHHGRTNLYTFMFEGKTINLLPMTHDDIVKDNKDKSKDQGEGSNNGIQEYNQLSMLAISSGSFPWSISASDLDMPSHIIIHLHGHNSCIDKVLDRINYLLAKFEFSSNPHELMCLQQNICVFSMFAFFCDKFQIEESRGRLCFQGREDDVHISPSVPAISTPASIAVAVREEAAKRTPACMTVERVQTKLQPYIAEATALKSLSTVMHVYVCTHGSTGMFAWQVQNKAPVHAKEKGPASSRIGVGPVHEAQGDA
jgi:hypothetical protein